MSGRDEKLRALLAADANATAQYYPVLPRPRPWPVPPMWLSAGVSVGGFSGGAMGRWEFQFSEPVPFSIACLEWMLQMTAQHGGPLNVTFMTYGEDDLDEASIW